MNNVSIHKILEVINELEDLKIDEDQLQDNLTDLGMDSIAFIQIIVGLEDRFDCEIPDEKLSVSEMDTVEKIFIVLQELYGNQLK